MKSFENGYKGELGAERESLVKWTYREGFARNLNHGSSPMIISFDKGEMLLYHNYGDEDQNELMAQIDNYKGEDEQMETKIQELYQEVETYKQAIQDAKDALASAEQELDETLDAEYNQ